MTRDEKDTEITNRIAGLCHELELAIQEATNMGLIVDQSFVYCGMSSRPRRPISFSIVRNIQYGTGHKTERQSEQ